MTCDVCIDGLLIQEWTDAPHDFAVCLCDAGQAWRVTSNQGRRHLPLWRVWATRWGIDPARVFMLEAVYSAAELAAVGLSKEPAEFNRAEALLAAGRKAKR